jgi:hypothetical protein
MGKWVIHPTSHDRPASSATSEFPPWLKRLPCISATKMGGIFRYHRLLELARSQLPLFPKLTQSFETDTRHLYITNGMEQHALMPMGPDCQL